MIIEDIREKILTGKAILFCGAGFSISTINIEDKNPPLASQLSKEISNLGKFKESDNLKYTSDRYINENKDDLSELVQLLKNRFSIKKTPQEHINIMSYPWRRIYTTNYDDAIEVAAKSASIHLDSICIDDSSKDFFKRNDLCVHINGFINGLTEEKLRNDYLKLSKSSYFSTNSFEKSNWYHLFKKDLQNASLILFIGYSLYDCEIEKILFEGSYREKTCFINAKSEADDTVYNLKQYGSVFTIGVDDFGNQLGECEVSTLEDVKIDNKGSICKYELLESSEVISDNEIQSFIMQGDIRDEYINPNYIAASKKAYIIKRNNITEALDALKNENNVFIYAEFGNGKTVFLEQLKSKLTMEGKKVYFTTSPSEYLESDFDYLLKNEKKFILVIDSYSKYLDFIRYVLDINNPNVLLVLADKSGLHERNYEILNESCHQTMSFRIDKLIDDELNQMTSIISNIGFWGERIVYSDYLNTEYLKDNCSSEISSILLGIFNSPQMKNRISDLVATLIDKESYKKTIFSICLLKLMDIPFNEAYISAMAENNEIYNSELINNKNFKMLFPSSNSGGIVKSSLFASGMIKNCFDANFIKECLLLIAKKFDALKYDGGYVEESIFKSVVKFNFVERLFPEQNKRTILVSYYDRLKSEVYWLQKDPHYWLQYGMAEINFKNLSKAEMYLNNSYSLAKGKEGYDTTDIDTQYARLLILKSLLESNGTIVISLFMKAHNLLINLPNDHYRARQVYLYKEFYDKKYKILNEKGKTTYKNACNQMLESMKSVDKTSNIRDPNFINYRLIKFFDSLLKE